MTDGGETAHIVWTHPCALVVCRNREIRAVGFDARKLTKIQMKTDVMVSVRCIDW